MFLSDRIGLNGLQTRHQKRCRNAFPRNIGKRNPKRITLNVKEVKVVASDLADRQAASSVVEVNDYLAGAPEQVLLHVSGNLNVGFRLLCLRSQPAYRFEKARIVPRLLNKISRAASHGFDGE